MERTVQQRAWRTDFDVADSEGRIVSGIAVPFNSPTQIFEHGLVFNETWVRGSTKENIEKRGNRIKVLGFHDSRALPLGKPVNLEDRADGMWIEARISDTQAGNEALTLVRDGVLDGFSVGFSIPEGGDTWNKSQTERTITRANVHEVSLVNFPAFDRARVEAIRAADGMDAMPMEGMNPADMPRHPFEDNGGTGTCTTCGLSYEAGNHEARSLDQTILDDFAEKRFRLQVLRAEIIRPRSLT